MNAVVQIVLKMSQMVNISENEDINNNEVNYR